jgi:hypothetical protein
MTTLKKLIEQLQEIEDKDQTVIFQYYLAEHFELDGEEPTAKQFDQAATDLDDSSLWDDSGETLNDYLCGLMYRDREDN